MSSTMAGKRMVLSGVVIFSLAILRFRAQLAPTRSAQRIHGAHRDRGGPAPAEATAGA